MALTRCDFLFLSLIMTEGGGIRERRGSTREREFAVNRHPVVPLTPPTPSPREPTAQSDQPVALHYLQAAALKFANGDEIELVVVGA